MKYELIVISSDVEGPISEARLRPMLPAFMLRSFQSAHQALSYLRQPRDFQALVLVDSEVGDISPLNLVDALRNEHPRLPVILGVDKLDDSIVARSMLAGALAIVRRGADSKELVLAIDRVLSSIQVLKEEQSLKTEKPAQINSNIVSFLGVRGGAGRSTLSSLFALSASLKGFRVALVDLDMQAGDLNFIFNKDEPLSFIEAAQISKQNGSSLKDYGHKVSHGLTLYAFKPSPEQQDLLIPECRSLIAEISEEYDLVVINTGAFWTQLHLELLDITSLAFCVSDQSVVGSRVTQRFFEQLKRYSFPVSACALIVNRFSLYGLSLNDIRGYVGCSEIFSVTRGPEAFELFQESGNPNTVFEKSPQTQSELDHLVDFCAAKLGVSAPGVQVFEASMEQEKKARRWFSWS